MSFTVIIKVLCLIMKVQYAFATVLFLVMSIAIVMSYKILAAKNECNSKSVEWYVPL